MQQQVKPPSSKFDLVIDRFDAAVRQPSTKLITSNLKRVLCQLIEEGSLCLPEELCRPLPDHYARRLWYRSEELGYAVVAMVWGLRQGTPLHDHSGTWCVEGVIDGTIEVTHYELLDRDSDRWCFARRGTVKAGVGSAGSLIPPFDYHTIKNSSGERCAITLHIYGHEMDHCSIFEPQPASGSGDEGWYVQRVRSLSYDP